MTRTFITAILLLATALLPATTPADETNLPEEARLIWQQYLDDSSRDQETKDFLALRMTSLVRNLEILQLQFSTDSAKPASFVIQETFNLVSGDFQMLDATLRNLQQLSRVPVETRDADLRLLTDLGALFGKIKTLTGLE